MPECGAHVGRGLITYPCTLEKGHDGPCYALENGPSARQRKAWEEERAVGRETATAVLAPPTTEQVIDLSTTTPSNTLQQAVEALTTAVETIEKLIGRRQEVLDLLTEIDAVVPDDAVEARSAISMLQAMFRV